MPIRHRLYKQILSAGFGLLTLYSWNNSWAFGLGEIELHSKLGEPLNARISVVDAADWNNGQQKVRLVSPPSANQETSGVGSELSQLRIGMSGPAQIDITSQTPIKEPYLHFLVEISGPDGRLVREYTLFLDPVN